MNRMRKLRSTGANQDDALAVSSTSKHVQSRTFQYAIDSSAIDIPYYAQPRSPVEQYWAVRALMAETLLFARTTHHREMRRLVSSEERKRSREISELSNSHGERQTRLERLVLALLLSFAALAILIIYSLLPFHRPESPLSRSRWSLPSHFTIPILSPFTSVTEHEISTISPRVVFSLLLFGSLLLYAMFRHWMGRRH